MMWGDVGPLAAFLQFTTGLCIAVIGILVVGRGGALLHRSPARPAWVASLFALIGMLTLDVLIPLDSLNTAMGGYNLWNLIQALSATCAFWYFYRSVRMLAYGLGTPQPPTVVLIVGLVAQSTAFALIRDHSGPPATFVVDHITDPACFAYLTIYIAGVAALALLSMWAIAPKLLSIYALFFIGYALIGTAALSHLCYLTFAFASGTPDTYEQLRQGFYVLFVPGVAVLCVAFGAVFAQNRWKRAQLVWRVRAARTEALMRKTNGLSPSRRATLRAAFSAEPRAHSYTNATAIYDALLDDDVLLTSRERRLVEAINSDLLVHLGVAEELASLSRVMA